MGKGGMPYNLKIIQAVEKHPCLYNYNLSEYSKREIVSAAWETVAKDVEDTVANCKGTWRNLRIVFTRHCKKSPSGSASKKKRRSWLVEAMQFVQPYIQTKQGHYKPSNLPSTSRSSTTVDAEFENPAVIKNTFENKNLECVKNLDEDSAQARLTDLKETKKESLRVDVDNCVMEYITSKQQSKKESSKQRFLLSLLPDLEQMNDRQMRQFRTRVSLLIDEILSVEFTHTTATASSPTSWLTEGETSNTHAAEFIYSEGTMEEQKIKPEPDTAAIEEEQLFVIKGDVSGVEKQRAPFTFVGVKSEIEDDENNDDCDDENGGDSDSSPIVEWVDCIKKEIRNEATYDDNKTPSIGKQVFKNNEELHKCKCDDCGKGFTYPSQLKSHVVSHSGEKTCVCKICGKRYTNAFNLKIHSRTHTGEKPYVCDMCGKGFVQSSGLKTHTLSHTGEKPHVCKICLRRFVMSSHLTEHSRIHTGEKPFVCSKCGRGFCKRSNLRSHVGRHSDYKPHECTVCRKAFMHPSELKTHVLTHTGEKPHGCEICGKCFALSSNLKKHVVMHSGQRIS